MSNTASQTVTVDDALKRGNRLMRYPTVFIVIAFAAASIIVTVVYNLLPFLIPVMVLAGIFSACLYWSNASVSWRLWAFANVRNVHELKARAIKKGLMDARPNFFTRLEIWTPAQKAQWQALQYKFSQPDVFKDDDTVPAETVIRYSKINAVFYMCVGLLIFCVGGGAYFKHNGWVGMALSVLIGITFVTIGIAQFNNQKPQIIINTDGLTIPPRPLDRWGQINSEEVIKPSGKTGTRYLVYSHGAIAEKIILLGLDVSPDRLAYLLRIYRGRSKKR